MNTSFTEEQLWSMLPVPDKIKEEMRVACLEEYEAKRQAEETAPLGPSRGLEELEDSPPITESDTDESSSGSDKENDLPEWAVTEPNSPVSECECEGCWCEGCSCEACEACDLIKLNAEEK